MGMVAMRTVGVLIILILIIGASIPAVSAVGIEHPVRSDVFLYEYFSQVLVRLDYSLRYAYANDTYSLTLANLTLRELGLIKEEAIYYQSKGINATVMKVIPPFYRLASETLTLVQLTLQFRRKPTPALASGMLSTIDEMYGTLSAIDAIKLRNGTKVLVFNTTELRVHLAAIEKLAKAEVPHEKTFLLGISDANPIINQTVTLFGSCPHNSPVTIVISRGNFTDMVVVNPVNNRFSLSYRFETPGSYELYALQENNRSNSINVTVRRVPSIFIVGDTFTALINHTVTLTGKLVDYYGTPLAGREVKLGNVTIVTGQDGGFSRTFFSSKALSLSVTLRFGGDSLHAPATKTVSVIFSKYPVTLTLNGPGEITKGKTAEFSGTVEPNVGPLFVYISGKVYETLTPTNGTFSFSFKPNSTGEFNVYVAFNGSSTYDRAASNVVVLRVVPPANMLSRYVAIALLAVLLAGAVYMLRGRRPGPSVVDEPRLQAVGKPLIDRGMIIPEDVGGAYLMLRRKLHKAFRIGESLTPREVLRVLHEWDLHPELETVTLLHEKAVYGGVQLGPEELDAFREAIKTLLGGIPV